MATGILWLNAAVFISYGLGFVFAVEQLSIWVTGAAPSTPSGLIDMRSTYGGMSLAVGAFLVMCGRETRFHVLGLRSVALIMACMAGARTLGLAIDGAPNAVMWVYLGVEVFMLGLAAWASSRLSSAESVAAP